MSVKHGYFIAVEGIDGSGKTTIIEQLCARYAHDSRFAGVVQTREPGGTPVAEQIRQIIFEDVTPPTEALLFAAARVEHVERCILPALAAGKLVVSDRYIDSSYVYQGRYLTQEQITMINQWALQKCWPDLTIVLTLPVAVGYQRMARPGREMNRLDAQPTAFHEAIAAGYRGLKAAFPGRNIQVVDVNCPLAEAVERVLKCCEEQIDA